MYVLSALLGRVRVRCNVNGEPMSFLCSLLSWEVGSAIPDSHANGNNRLFLLQIRVAFGSFTATKSASSKE